MYNIKYYYYDEFTFLVITLVKISPIYLIP